MTTPKIRRNYQDSLFCHLFGSEERKGNALELYNALAQTTYDDPADIELTTIGDAIFLGRKNDVSFLIGDEMVMFEHQSTHNPNMPVRGLQYFSRLFGKLIEERQLDLYDNELFELPTPRYIVLYFGADDRPDREVMRLSDSFAVGPGDLEVKAHVINCNEGHNRAIIEACEALKGYSRLVTLARQNQKDGMSQDAAVKAAVTTCINEGVLTDYLSAHRAEVEEMLFTIQDEERAMRVHWENVERKAEKAGMEKGMAQGMAEGMAEGMAKGMAKGMAEGVEQGMADGLKQGLEQGVKEGREDALAQSVSNLMSSLSMSAEEAADALGIPAEIRPDILGHLAQ